MTKGGRWTAALHRFFSSFVTTSCEISPLVRLWFPLLVMVQQSFCPLFYCVFSHEVYGVLLLVLLSTDLAFFCGCRFAIDSGVLPEPNLPTVLRDTKRVDISRYHVAKQIFTAANTELDTKYMRNSQLNFVLAKPFVYCFAFFTCGRHNFRLLLHFFP